MALTKKGLLWQSQGTVDISQFFRQMLELGFNLSRGHAKNSPSGGRLDTYQTMLVFDKPTIEYSEEQREHNVLTAFSDENRREIEHVFLEVLGPNYKVMIFANDRIARVPEHLYMKCGMPTNKTGRPVLAAHKGEFIIKDGPNFDLLTFDDVLKEVEMLRLSLNILPADSHLIPMWLEERSRYDRTKSVQSIEDSASRL